MVVVEWTGSYPNLCHGEWRLTIGGVDWTNAIPVEKRYTHMNTAGTYSSWHFEDWQEVFEDYEDGLGFDDWVLENPWIHDIPANPFDLYLSFQAHDWRHGECGGCI